MSCNDELSELLINWAARESAMIRETVTDPKNATKPGADLATVRTRVELLAGYVSILGRITGKLAEATRELLPHTKADGPPELVTWDEAQKPNPAPVPGVDYDDMTIQAGPGELQTARFQGSDGKFRLGVIQNLAETGVYVDEGRFNAACLQHIGQAIREAEVLGAIDLDTK